MLRAVAVAGCVVALLLESGCRSAYVEAHVHNGTGAAITLLEVDYPSASFGKEELPAGADFRYRFKILGSGKTKAMWTDAQHKEHAAPGPDLSEGQSGTLEIKLSASGAEWQTNLTPK